MTDFAMPPETAGFAERAAWVIEHLCQDLTPLTAISAAGIVGNLGGESHLRAIHEIGLPNDQGGIGWAQWTASRRSDFEQWCADNSLQWTDDEANYRFLVHELQTSQAHALDRVRQCTAVDSATYTFEVYFERPADVQGTLPDRINYAQQALDAYNAMIAVEIPPRPAPSPPAPTIAVSPEPPSEPAAQPPLPPSIPARAAPAPPASIPPEMLSRMPWWVLPGLTLTVLALFAYGLHLADSTGDKTLLTQMLTAVVGAMLTALGYFFGSSAGSEKKDSTIASVISSSKGP